MLWRGDMEDLVRQVQSGRVPGRKITRTVHTGRGVTALGRFLEDIRAELELKPAPFAKAFECSYTHLRNVAYGDRPISEEMIENGLYLLRSSDLPNREALASRFLKLAYREVWKVTVPTRDNPEKAEAVLLIKAMMEDPDRSADVHALLEWLEKRHDNT